MLLSLVGHVKCTALASRRYEIRNPASQVRTMRRPDSRDEAIWGCIYKTLGLLWGGEDEDAF